MAKYDPLVIYLKAQPFYRISMTFDEIERVVGFALPPAANAERAWWSDNAMTSVWAKAGFRIEQVDMASRRLVFRRDDERSSPTRPAPRAPEPRDPPDAGHAPRLFGCLKGTVTLAAGLDLTAPPDIWRRSPADGASA
jgi:hypothetical protein